MPPTETCHRIVLIRGTAAVTQNHFRSARLPAASALLLFEMASSWSANEHEKRGSLASNPGSVTLTPTLRGSPGCIAEPSLPSPGLA
jgi:hypothetical protein